MDRTAEQQSALIRAEDSLTRALDACMDAYDVLLGFKQFREAAMESVAAAGFIVTVADMVAALREESTDGRD